MAAITASIDVIIWTGNFIQAIVASTVLAGVNPMLHNSVKRISLIGIIG